MGTIENYREHTGLSKNPVCFLLPYEENVDNRL
jgi:hypothetical protein